MITSFNPSRAEFSPAQLQVIIFLIRIKAYVEEHEKGDYLVNTPDKKANPWMDKVIKDMKLTLLIDKSALLL